MLLNIPQTAAGIFGLEMSFCYDSLIQNCYVVYLQLWLAQSYVVAVASAAGKDDYDNAGEDTKRMGL